ncbi:hypothetical protein OCH239_18590 [Roseivivax halodurans JCM 10272]|uniref:Sodium:proton symporter n=1 Tax=Roseivivax halodurans JCM 10272 TaxID=1449350 RepID=X7E7I4_9RHOB|nr:hypothetical protein [Roseivivax halodurans]ETX12024.1 hypothetical protein OCH239_18590 [Roseivivax halodurans JCM 10272]
MHMVHRLPTSPSAAPRLAFGIGTGLAWAGTQSPLLLLGTMVLGAVVPELGGSARAVLPEAAAVMVLGSFLAAALSPSELTLSRLRFSAALAATWVLPVALVWLVTSAVEVSPELRLGLVLSVVGPPVASAAALAAILGLAPRLALWLTMPPLVLAPLSLPALTRLFGSEIALDLGQIAMRLLVMIGSAGALALVLLALRRLVPALLPSTNAAAGISILGLALVGLSAAGTARLAIDAEAILFCKLCTVSLIVTLGLWAAGAVLFRQFGRCEAMTIGFLVGNRNQTLVWAAAGAQFTPLVDSYIVAAILPTLILPAALRLVLDFCRKPYPDFAGPEFLHPMRKP